MATAASPLRELADAAHAAQTITLESTFDLPGGTRLELNTYGYQTAKGGWQGMGNVRESVGKKTHWHQIALTDLADVFRSVARTYPKAVLRPDSVKVRTRKSAVTGTKLVPLALQAWHEAFGLPIPSMDDLKKVKREKKAARQASGQELAALLATGEDGVRAYNARSADERKEVDLRKASLAGARLDGVRFGGADLEEADLSGASLRKAHFAEKFQHGRLAKANLSGADLYDAQMPACRASKADFSGANLFNIDARGGSFKEASFRKANLEAADLGYTDLHGADFTGANLEGANLDDAAFDDQTRWPRGFKIPSTLRWKGVGVDPRLAPTAQEKRLPKPADFPAFLKRLEAVTDSAKLDKAMKMLKAERFQLFARVKEDGLVGVVKSQSDPDLVYSGRLTSDGKYSCCTQNLNVCGGLRGSPCKHLLVLIVGLTKAGEIDPATAHDWVQSSRGRKPELDRDAAAESLLQYKGAEAGEIDWRPTETLPEDYYAF